MLELFTLFILTLMDCCLTTIRTLLMIKNKNFLSSIFNTLASCFYLLSLVKLNQSKSTSIAILTICSAKFLGSYLPAFLFKKLEKEKVYIFDIIPGTKDQGNEIADSLRDNNLAIRTYKGFNTKKESVLCCKVFSNSKAESTLIEDILPKNITYNITETIKHVNINS